MHFLHCRWEFFLERKVKSHPTSERHQYTLGDWCSPVITLTALSLGKAQMKRCQRSLEVSKKHIARAVWKWLQPFPKTCVFHRLRGHQRSPPTYPARPFGQWQLTQCPVRGSPSGTAVRAAWSLPLRRLSRSYFDLASDEFTWSKSFRRAILLVTSSWARSSFSCSNLMLASCNLRFSLCGKKTTAQRWALVAGRTSSGRRDWWGRTSSSNTVNFCRSERGGRWRREAGLLSGKPVS